MLDLDPALACQSIGTISALITFANVARRNRVSLKFIAKGERNRFGPALIAINHCQNSATCRTTWAAGYHHQSRVLRDQKARGARGRGKGPSETWNPFDTSENSVQPFYAPVAFACRYICTEYH